MRLFDKVKMIDEVLYDFFQNPSNPRTVAAKDMMDEFIRVGIFKKDVRNGLPIREVLRKLDEKNCLQAIPFVSVVRKASRREWYFSASAYESYLKSMQQDSSR